MAARSLSERTRLTAGEIHALNASAFAADQFEPFVGRMIDGRVLRKVVANGLVEIGPSCRPAVGNVGYRLTSEGWSQFRETQLGKI